MFMCLLGVSWTEKVTEMVTSGNVTNIAQKAREAKLRWLDHVLCDEKENTGRSGGDENLRKEEKRGHLYM